MGALLKRIEDKNSSWHMVYDICEESNNGSPFIVYYVREKSRGSEAYDAYILPIKHKEKLLAYRDNSMFHRRNFVVEFGKMFIKDGKYIRK